jgi:hypothetical protein
MSSKTPAYPLDLNYPENNPNNWFAFKVDGIRHKNHIKNIIVLRKHVVDGKDLDTGGLKLTIQPCGTMLSVEEHSVPSYDWDQFEKSLDWMLQDDKVDEFGQAPTGIKDHLQSALTHI